MNQQCDQHTTPCDGLVDVTGAILGTLDGKKGLGQRVDTLSETVSALNTQVGCLDTKVSKNETAAQERHKEVMVQIGPKDRTKVRVAAYLSGGGVAGGSILFSMYQLVHALIKMVDQMMVIT